MDEVSPERREGATPVPGSTGPTDHETNPTGQLNLESILAGMAAAPFLQAIFSELGNRVGVTVGVTLEDTLSRLRRMRGGGQEDHESTAEQKIEFVECAGWIVMIEPGVPVEALAGLHQIRGATIQ
ncbi:hypothetical protein GCM10010277_85340 [Streptomyces longisporoflavus]|uniref:hypothetical protein n=1 Tax=Streptomyces longisporoflavus TaxID=28044 RepID=UPI00167E76B6|nr:hypothetical protein [Streptomyces longisporoflavus]GGV72414.1 hypothetical protein GCM10010277_85340 [Streptomyces longisporoflavus]